MRILLLLSLMLSLVAEAQRVALVVGISTYPEEGAFDPLPCARRDAELVGKALAECGFEVVSALDVDKAGFDRKVDEFFEKIVPGGDAVFYFAGHGVQWDGKNYLLAGNAQFRARYRLGEETVEAQTVLAAMSERKPSNALAFLDCCRNPPGESWLRSEVVPRSQRRAGLAAMQHPNVLVNFAAAANQSALEPVGGENGLYAVELAKGIQSGSELSAVLKQVTRSVIAESRRLTANEREQRPYLSGSLLGDFWFSRKAEPEVPLPRGQIKRGRYAGEKWELTLPGGVPMMMRWIPPTGSEGFQMGSPENEAGRDDDERQHQVILTEGFWMGETEVTQRQWQAVMGRSQHDQVDLTLADEVAYQIGEKKQTMRKHYEGWFGKDYEKTLKNFAGGGNYPIWGVSWEEAMEFGRLVQLGSGGQFGELMADLPSEAQWEWACRSGSKEATYGGNLTIKGKRHAPELDGVAWYAGNSSVAYPEGKGVGASWSEKQYPGGRAGPREVGKKQANRWGLRDMIGNVWEWTGDRYGPYPEGAVTDPAGPSGGLFRVLRGGGWNGTAAICRSAYRNRFSPSIRFVGLGFRVVLQVPAGKQ